MELHPRRAHGAVPGHHDERGQRAGVPFDLLEKVLGVARGAAEGGEVRLGHQVHARRVRHPLDPHALGQHGLRRQSRDLGHHQRFRVLRHQPGLQQAFAQVGRPVMAVVLPLELASEPGEVAHLLGDRRVRRALVEVGPEHGGPAVLALAHVPDHAVDVLDQVAGAVPAGFAADLSVVEREHR
jgi:hypothetical protein